MNDEFPTNGRTHPELTNYTYENWMLPDIAYSKN